MISEILSDPFRIEEITALPTIGPDIEFDGWSLRLSMKYYKDNFWNDTKDHSLDGLSDYVRSQNAEHPPVDWEAYSESWKD